MSASIEHEYLRCTPAELGAPWAEPTVAWRHRDREDRAWYLRQQVARGQSFIVREVLVRSPTILGYQPLTVPEIEDTLEATEDEFAHLANEGITAAPTSWHIFTDSRGLNRVLARVAVYDGREYCRASDTKENDQEGIARNDILERINHYYKNGANRRRLNDVYRTDQYLHSGTFRDSDINVRFADATRCLIDTEPIFWLK